MARFMTGIRRIDVIRDNAQACVKVDILRDRGPKGIAEHAYLTFGDGLARTGEYAYWVRSSLNKIVWLSDDTRAWLADEVVRVYKRSGAGAGGGKQYDD